VGESARFLPGRLFGTALWRAKYGPPNNSIVARSDYTGIRAKRTAGQSVRSTCPASERESVKAWRPDRLITIDVRCDTTVTPYKAGIAVDATSCSCQVRLG